MQKHRNTAKRTSVYSTELKQEGRAFIPPQLRMCTLGDKFLAAVSENDLKAP